MASPLTPMARAVRCECVGAGLILDGALLAVLAAVTPVGRRRRELAG
jgi:hypothetical protein